jgi:hypothetical protein
MSLPPSVKALIPSLRLDEVSNITTLSTEDFKKLIAFALEHIHVDEDWYIARYSDVRDASQSRGSKNYAVEHYRTHGFLEGRLPQDPVVDEVWYRETYPDVDEAIRIGRETSAKSHFVDQGYHEGRKPVPDAATIAPLSARPDSVRPGTRAPISRIPVRQLSG